MSAELRRATLSDLDALLELERLFPGDRISRSAWRHLLRSASSEVWVAVAPLGAPNGGRVVGDAVLSLRRGSRSARMSTLVVDPSARRSGVARALLNGLEARALARGAERLRLEVRSDNSPAIAFYRRAGYRQSGTRPAYYEDGAEALLMEKPLVGA